MKNVILFFRFIFACTIISWPVVSRLSGHPVTSDLKCIYIYTYIYVNFIELKLPTKQHCIILLLCFTGSYFTKNLENRLSIFQVKFVVDLLL